MSRFGNVQLRYPAMSRMGKNRVSSRATLRRDVHVCSHRVKQVSSGVCPQRSKSVDRPGNGSGTTTVKRSHGRRAGFRGRTAGHDEFRSTSRGFSAAGFRICFSKLVKVRQSASLLHAQAEDPESVIQIQARVHACDIPVYRA